MSDELHVRMSAVEKDVERLQELVDGQEPWAHRKRLHELENYVKADSLVAQALDELRRTRDRRGVKLREWGSLALATAALLITWHPWS